jgi:hypothetical protein
MELSSFLKFNPIEPFQQDFGGYCLVHVSPKVGVLIYFEVLRMLRKALIKSKQILYMFFDRQSN